MKLTGIKKAVGEYQEANKGGYYSPRYAHIMLDRSTGEVWTDEFYSLGQNQWKEYNDKAIIDLGHRINGMALKVNMANVREYASLICDEYVNAVVS